jgi:hypothetical protein
MAAIQYKMNNLTITVSGVNGNMDACTYTNLDPVEYVFKAENFRTGHMLLYRFHANTTTVTPLAGFRKLKTDEVKMSFLGAVFPGA